MLEPTLPIGASTPIQPISQTQANKNNSIYIKRAETSEPKGKFILGEKQRLSHLQSIYGDKALKQMGIVECATCASRTYVDGSNDPGVSFKTPTKISPEQSFSAVAGHEMEHVSNERSSAIRENAEIVSQSVVLHNSICPECGVSYTSGGKTTTVTKRTIPQNVKTGELVDVKL